MNNARTLLWPHSALIATSSLLISITLWYILSEHHFTTLTCTVPIYIYNTNKDTIQQVPQGLTVTLQGTRHELRHLDYKRLGLYIDAKKWRNTQRRFTNADLFLPPSIKLVSYSPSNLTIIIED